MEHIELEHRGRVAHIRLNRPERRNAQVPAMWHELRVTGQALAQDADVRCVILSGNGAGFSAGLDIKAHAAGEITGAEVGERPRSSGGPVISDTDLQVAQAAFRWPAEAPFLTVAAVHGHALGAGFELALACDLRILAEDAVLGLPEAELGMMPDMGGCERLGQLAGYSAAVELSLTCRRISAAEALDLGLATSVVPADQLLKTAEELADLVASRPATTIRFVKQAAAAGAAGRRDASFALARQGAIQLGVQRRAAARSS